MARSRRLLHGETSSPATEETWRATGSASKTPPCSTWVRSLDCVSKAGDETVSRSVHCTVSEVLMEIPFSRRWRPNRLLVGFDAGRRRSFYLSWLTWRSIPLAASIYMEMEGMRSASKRFLYSCYMCCYSALRSFWCCSGRSAVLDCQNDQLAARV